MMASPTPLGSSNLDFIEYDFLDQPPKSAGTLDSVLYRASKLPTMPSYTESGSNATGSSSASLQVPKPCRARLMSRVSWAVSEVWENHVEEMNIPRATYHFTSFVYLAFILYLLYWLLPIHGHWSAGQGDKVPTLTGIKSLDLV